MKARIVIYADEVSEEILRREESENETGAT